MPFESGDGAAKLMAGEIEEFVRRVGGSPTRIGRLFLWIGHDILVTPTRAERPMSAAHRTIRPAPKRVKLCNERMLAVGARG